MGQRGLLTSENFIMDEKPYRKKLIEVALPLVEINREASREKSIRHGHPSTLHNWWARRPLAACRAVLFASLVDDPSSRTEEFPTEEAQEKERQRLFRLLAELVKWENTSNERILKAARKEIVRSTQGHPPAVLDPFCGGGSIPLEAQRLGLKAYASDLNPVAVLITKGLIEIPIKFSGHPPVHPAREKELIRRKWLGAGGLAEDIRFYGAWIREQAQKRIGRLYPKVILPKEQGGGEATVIAWLWTRTVKCPNPACSVQMPLARSFQLSGKGGKRVWVEPVTDDKRKVVRFELKTGSGSVPPGSVNRRGATCVVCKTPVSFGYIRAEGKAARIVSQLMAVVAKGAVGRLYVPANEQQQSTARMAKPTWIPETNLPDQALGFRVQLYGMTKHAHLFSPRQLVALTTFCDLIEEARKCVLKDFKTSAKGRTKEREDTRKCATAYADAVATYLAFAVDRCANYWSTLTPWGGDFIVQTFGRQTLAMVWDYAEANPFSDATGSWVGALEWIAKCLEQSVPASGFGMVKQLDATAAVNGIDNPLICTDPPYYDNIGYADLSDYFYTWLRRTLGKIYPDLFSTVLTPKAQELIASPYRFGGDKDKAKAFFEVGLEKAFIQMRKTHNQDYPLTIYYAFKQSEKDREEDGSAMAIASTGWETMLEGLLRAGFMVTGTWPLRTERAQGLKTGTNALASSILLVCRLRPKSAPLATRREFVSALRSELAIRGATSALVGQQLPFQHSQQRDYY